MKIAVLGWGSLIWHPKELGIEDEKWYDDGPLLPIEFKRVSADGRLTLIICCGYLEVVSLYAVSSFDNLALACNNLRLREGTAMHHIGFFNFQNGDKQIKKENECILPNLFLWQQHKDIDAVIWTDLASNFEQRTGLAYTIENVRIHLQKLDTESFQSAKRYVENAPTQINTNYRHEIKSIFDQLSNESTSS